MAAPAAAVTGSGQRYVAAKQLLVAAVVGSVVAAPSAPAVALVEAEKVVVVVRTTVSDRSKEGNEIMACPPSNFAYNASSPAKPFAMLLPSLRVRLACPRARSQAGLN